MTRCDFTNIKLNIYQSLHATKIKSLFLLNTLLECISKSVYVIQLVMLASITGNVMPGSKLKQIDKEN